MFLYGGLSDDHVWCFVALCIPILHCNQKAVGRGAGHIYSFNSIGSALGAFTSGFFLIPALGFFTTSLFASVVNILIGLYILFLGKELPDA